LLVWGLWYWHWDLHSRTSHRISFLAYNFSSLRDTANQNIELLQHNLENAFGLRDNRLEEFLKQHVNNIFETSAGGINKIFSTTTGAIFRTIILPVYVFLFLYYRTKFAHFILKIVQKKNQKVTLTILREISSVATRYMGGVAIVGFILCILNSTGLFIIGVEYAMLLGIISAFFNFIPYFGTLMGGSVPLIFVLLTTEDPLNYGVKVGILFAFVQILENNLLTPNIVGGNVKINPFFIILGLVFVSMVWGIPGMLLIIPFLAIVRIILSNIPSFTPYAYLLGPSGTKKNSIAMGIKKIRRAFKHNMK
jgi:predicted PurR-regulated permease PerM